MPDHDPRWDRVTDPLDLLESLPRHAWRRYWEAVEHLQDPVPDVAAFAVHADAILSRLLDAEYCTYSEVDAAAGRIRVWMPVHCSGLDDLVQHFVDLTADNRVWAWTVGPGGAERRLSDFLPDLRRDDDPVFREVVAHLGANRSIEIDLGPVASISPRLTAVRCSDADFDDATLGIAGLIRPHLLRGYQRAVLAQWRSLHPMDAARLAPLPLTRRQRDLAGWLCAEKTNEEIAAILGTSRETVKLQLSALYRRLGVQGRVGAALALTAAMPETLACAGCTEAALVPPGP